MAFPMASGFEPIARGLYLEGLAYDPVRDCIWYSDVIAGGIYGVSPDGRALASFNPERMWTGGILLNDDGAVLSSGAGGIMWNQPESGASGWLCDQLENQPINGINEMIPVGSGGIYFGTVDLEQIVKGEPTRPSALYHLGPTGNAVSVAENLGFANGMMLSTDRKRLFYNDTFDATYAFDVKPDCTLGRRTLLRKQEDCDGMALDADGNLWVTGYKSSALIRMTPDGTVLDEIATPAEAITQIRFGGADLRDVYLTAVPVDSGDNLAVGEMPDERKSILYRGRSSVAGQPISPTSFKFN